MIDKYKFIGLFLEDFESKFIDMEDTLINLDNKLLDELNLSEQYSLFNYNYLDAIESGFYYPITEENGLNIIFEFENEDKMSIIEETIFKISDIQFI